MYKYKTIFPFLMAVLMVTAAYGQENLKNNQTKSISGAVTNIDFVANTISILTDVGQHQMSFFVPGNASIIRDMQNIGLMDIRQNHPVTIQYDVSSVGKDIVVNIVDNEPTANE